MSVSARNPESLAMARAVGCRTFSLDELEEHIGGMKYIVNTVPARIIGESALCCIDPQALLLELASQPGGFDKNMAENIGVNVCLAPGLPGKCAPFAAAKLMHQAVCQLVNQWEE